MNKLITIAAILSLALVASMVLIPTGNAMPGIKRPMDFYVATIQGGSPQTVDYSWAYDTASGEIIFNTMDTLIMFNAEHTDTYFPNIATSWSVTNLGGIDLFGIPIAGLNFENPANQTGPNAKYYYRYTFGIPTTPIFFHDFPNGSTGYQLTATDIVYSFQRTLVQDRLSGPNWMLWEPLMDNPVDADLGDGGLANLTIPAQVAEVGRLIEKAVMVNPGNSSEIWFNLMFPAAYSPFLQILTQTWSSIESKSWIINEVINGAGRPDWNGNIASGGYTDWLNFHNPAVSPLDNPTPMEYGSGPFILVPGTPDYVNNFWAMTRFIGYHGGWPSSFPTPSSPNYQGYVNTVEETWNFAWAAASQLFKNGDADFVAVPSLSFINELYQSSTPPFDPPNYPQNGIRCIHPLPNLAVDAMFFTFNIATNTLYQPLSAPGVFDPSAIPPDFFGNATWGVHVRRAFAYLFDYNTFLATSSLGEGTTQPDVATALISGLRYYNKTLADQVGFSYNIAKATAEFNLVPGLMATGFTLNLVYNTGNLERKTACDLIASALTAINPLFKTVEINVDWNPYLTAAVYNQMPLFIIGWLVDFPDPHDFTLPFYHTGGAFASWQAYSNSTMDALVEKGIQTPDDLTPYSSAPGHHERQDVYNAIVKAAIQDVPSVTIIQGVGRHFERDWVNGWYFNQAYPGGYYYNRWKWYYVTPALYNVSSTASLNQPNSTNLPCDVNYDGKIDITDVATVAKAFGSVYGPPISTRWQQKADINNDRKIDITDVATVAKQFGKKATPQPGTWVPQGLLVTVVPVVRTMSAGESQQFNSTVIGGTPAYAYQWYLNGSQILGANSANYVFTSPGNGVYYLQLKVNDSTTNKGESPLLWVTSAPLTVTVDPTTMTLNMTRKERGDFFSSVDGGTTPYMYKWFTKNDTGVHDWVVAFATTYGNDGSQYRFSSRAGQGSNSAGQWELKVQVTDTSSPTPFAVNSTASIIQVVA